MTRALVTPVTAPVEGRDENQNVGVCSFQSGPSMTARPRLRRLRQKAERCSFCDLSEGGSYEIHKGVPTTSQEQTYCTAALKTSSILSAGVQPVAASSCSRLSFHIGWEIPPKETSPS